MLKTIPQYLSTMSDTFGLTKTLGVIDVCCDANGRLKFHVGNNSVIFKIRNNGREQMLKCYTRNKHNLRRIYGDRCLHDELFVHSDYSHGEWVDVVLDDWIEGHTLYRAIVNNLHNPDKIKSLAEKFDRLAYQLLNETWAHGDLKPDNIIVTPDEELRLIDFDAMFKPEFTGEKSEEIGTATFQHPARNINYFDKSIDDYPIALISTALHALSLDPTLAERYNIHDELLFHPKELVYGKPEALDEVLQLFAREGMAPQYCIARLLRSVTPKLVSLQQYMQYLTVKPEVWWREEDLCLDRHNGLWGYRHNEQFAIPPIYNGGFDFREGWAPVQLGEYWHYIDIAGRIVLKCPQFEAVKPFRNGEATVIENGVRKIINRQGEQI